MVLALSALLVVILASAALAARYGESCGSDNINGGGGRDVIDVDRCGNDRDVANGGTGNDVIRADDGDPNDKVNGGPGNDDHCEVDSLREVVGKSCEEIEGTGSGNPNRELRELGRFI
jgi:Ca2+-binding RTX toxin-like protein